MPRYWGEGPHEMYHRKEDGLWYFPGSINGYKTLEEAQEGYRRRDGMLNSSETDSCLAVITMLVLIVLAFIIIFY